MNGKEDSRICNEPICRFVKGKINYIVTNTVSKKKRKEVYNEFYTELLESTDDSQEPGAKLGEDEIRFSIKDLCSLAKTDGNNKHLWGNTKDARDKDVIGDQYTPEIAKMYNILTSSLAVLCKSSDDTCNFERMKTLQLKILDETKSIKIKELEDIDGQLDNVDNDLEKIEDINISDVNISDRDVTNYINKITSIASIFGASSEYINENLIKVINSTSESTVYIISNIIRRMIDIMQRVSRIDVVGSFFGALECYNRFLISAIGNKLTTILNSVTIAGLTLGGVGFIGHAALVDTLNEQNLLQSAATLYYSSQFLEPTMQTLSATVDLGDSIKIYLMKSFPKALEKNINTVTKNIKKNIDNLAAQTKRLKITDAEKKIKDIIDFTKYNKDNPIIVENDENEVVELLNPALMTPEDIASLQTYVDENVKQAADLNEGEGDMDIQVEGQGQFKGGKKHKKSHKKRHQKTHKKQLKPKAKSHKKKNKPKAKSHKKK